jgi:tetratricopeptide (TPR) repeat protein
MKKHLTALLPALLLVIAQPALADPSPEELKKAEDLFNQAERLYKAGDFKEALEDYKQAYFITEFPDFLYNMAQCQKQLKNYEAALDLYHSYLRDVPDTPIRASVEATIKELEPLAKQQGDAPANNFKEFLPALKVPGIAAGAWAFTGITASVIANRIENTGVASPAFYNTGRAFALASDAALIAFGVTTFLAISQLQDKQKEKSVSLSPIKQGAAIVFTFIPEVSR